LHRLIESAVVESVAQEVAPFGTGSTIVEPGGARTEFRYGSPRSPSLCPSTTDAPAHSFLEMLDPASGLAPGDPARIAARIIDSVDVEPATLRARIADFEAQRELAASTDFPPSE
jgi:NAD(P)-dependent dehydrogenase (short-subunit alcohol dehydrogenase family)